MLDVAQQAINDVALWFETTEERLNKLVSNMRDDLLDLISVSDLLFELLSLSLFCIVSILMISLELLCLFCI